MRLRRDTERGATAVFVAGAIVLLMGIAAIATDVGAGFNERRQAQSAADFSALAAVAFSNADSVPSECDAHNPSDTLARAICRGAVEAMAVAQANLPGQTLDWATCTDPEPDRAALFPVVARVELAPGVLSNIPCIRFTSSTQGARVVVPDLEVPTTFGRILGISNLITAANAEVLADLIDLYRVIPFGVPANADGTYDCLKTGSNPDWGPCQGGSDTGHFGYLNIPTYGNPSMGTTPSVTPAGQCVHTNNVLTSNIVRGVDHPLGTHPNGTRSPGQPALRDGSGLDSSDTIHVCPIFGTNANDIAGGSGDGGAFDQGMTFGYGASERGRLWPLSGGITVRNGGGSAPGPTLVDDTPIWTYFTSYTGGPTAPCPHNSGITVGDTGTAKACLDSWNPGSGEIFDEAIRDAKRYMFAPRLHTTWSSASYYLIQAIVPVYLQTSYWGCSSGGGAGMAGLCDIIHSPGEPNTGSCAAVATATPPGSEPFDSTCGVPGNWNQRLDALTSFTLDPRMLPEEARLPENPAEFVRLALTR
ncbi:MAG TPA: pilus assembly protein TadG-related protein [Acidimicrobiia bacterium]|nr:pilus assembly protein TadG-related protein [Acidimicrobiia bacterium]